MVKNRSKNTVVAEKIIPKSAFGKISGLMFKKDSEAIVFKTRFGIHTFFLNFPIDLIILDKNNIVAITKKSVKPNRIIIWNPKYNTVLELPEKSITKSKTEKGDIIDLEL